MLKYVNPDFQISDLKTGDWVIVAGGEKNESNFQEIECKKQRYVFRSLKP